MHQRCRNKNSHLLWLIHLSSVRVNAPLEVFITFLGEVYTTSLNKCLLV